MVSLALRGTTALLLVACTPGVEEEEECRSFSLLQVSLQVGERRDEEAKASVAAALLDACPAEIFDAHQRELLMSRSGRGRTWAIPLADVLEDQWASVCPTDGLAQLKKLRPPVGEREIRAYELCEWDRFGIVERRELDTTTALGTVWGVYPALLAGGVPQDLSRRLARVLILGEGPGATRLVEDCSAGEIWQIELPPMDASKPTAWLIMNFDYLEVAPRWGRTDEPWDANKMCVRHGDGAWELVGPGARIQVPADIVRPQHWKLWGQHYYLRVIPGEELEFATTNNIWKVTRAHFRGPRFSADRVVGEVECVKDSGCAPGSAALMVIGSASQLSVFRQVIVRIRLCFARPQYLIDVVQHFGHHVCVPRLNLHSRPVGLHIIGSAPNSPAIVCH
jgi:hypothetical protein